MKNVELHDILMHNSSINLHIHDNSCTLTVVTWEDGLTINLRLL